MSIEVMKQAHEALGTADEVGFWELQKTAIAALRAAIKAAEKQEGWVLREVLFDKGEPIAHREPAQRQWVGLTDEQIDAIFEQHHNQYGECESPNFGYERAIEAKLKEKNT